MDLSERRWWAIIAPSGHALAIKDTEDAARNVLRAVDGEVVEVRPSTDSGAVDPSEHEALRAMYDLAVRVVDRTNPDLDRDRQQLSLLLDRVEPLVTPRGAVGP